MVELACAHCSTVFTPPSVRGRRSNCCSDECRQQYRCRRQNEYYRHYYARRWATDLEFREQRKRYNNTPAQRKCRRGTMRRRLKRDAPELYAKVVAGELTVTVAAVEAGFRKGTTRLQRLEQAWQKVSIQEQQAFLASVQAPGIENDDGATS